MWYLVEIVWDEDEKDYIGVWASNEREANKVAKKYMPAAAEKFVVDKKSAMGDVGAFLKKNSKVQIDLVVDKDGKEHSVVNGKVRGQVSEASMNKKREVKVYDKDRKKVLATVSPQTTSIGAAKAAGAKASQYAKVNGEYAWVVKESYTHYPSLKKLVNVNYTDPRGQDEGYKIHAEVDGVIIRDGKPVEGTYVMYEDEAYPGNYIAVHVANEMNEEDDSPDVCVVAMDKNRKLVRDRMAYRRRKSRASVNEALNEVFVNEGLDDMTGKFANWKKKNGKYYTLRLTKDGKRYDAFETKGKKKVAITTFDDRKNVVEYVPTPKGYIDDAAIKKLRKMGYSVKATENDSWGDPGRATPHRYHGDMG